MRYRSYLRHRYRFIAGHVGTIWVIVGLLILSPLLALPFYWSERFLIPAFAWPGAALIVAGLLLAWQFPRHEAADLTVIEGSTIVVLTWISAVLAGALPFLFAHDATFTQAVFEATSGWTTTGLSVFDVEQISPLFLLYRSIIQFAGGAGFAIIMLAALTGPVGMGLSAAEGREEQLEPHVRRSANIVLRLYFGYALLGILGLRLAGMDWFDATNHAFAALSTGGFSTHAASAGYWDNALIEAVLIVLMLLGTVNFLTSYAVVRGQWRELFRNSEVRLMAALLLLSIPALYLGVTRALYLGWSKAGRVALFEAVSALSTTGFATVSYTNWASLGWFILIFLMLVGGGTGSTAGGIKQARVYILLQALFLQIRRPLLPRTAIVETTIWQGGQRRFLAESSIRHVALFSFLHLGIVALGGSILMVYGYSFRDSLFEFASSVSTIGLSVGVTAPDAPAGVLWAEIGGMFLGRLEFFAVFSGIAKLFIDGSALFEGWRLTR